MQYPFDTIVDMHGRKVVITGLDNPRWDCADCPELASVKVIEVEKEPGTHWYWCGNCCIGG